MSIENLRRYIQLFDAQEDNTKEQKALLQEQLEAMEEKRDDLQAAIDHLNYKLNHFYDHMESTEEELRALEREHADKVAKRDDGQDDQASGNL